MYCLVVVLACLAVVSAVNLNECVPLTHPRYFQCCKKQLPQSDLVKECREKNHKKPPSCDADICIAKGRYGSDDGKINDMKALEAILEKDFENDPEIFEKIKKECINNDLSKYGLPDFCDLIKMKNCVHFQMILGCNDFSDEGRCKGFKELVEKCKDM